MHLLLLTAGAPLLGALATVLIPARRHGLIRGAALLSTAAALLCSLLLLRDFDRTTPALQFVERLTSPSSAATTYRLGVDGLSLPLVFLTTLLSFVAVVASLGVQQRVKGYFAWFLLLEVAILGVFEAQSWSMFYMFWELTLVPLFFLISIWGGKNRGVASMSFFLYTLAGSVFMLVALVAVHLQTPAHSFDMAEMAAARGGLPARLQVLAFIGFFIGFAVKIPVFPLHGWLPLAHVEAPTPVSVMLSGVLLKMGGYGLMRVTGLLPVGATALLPALCAFALVSILYGALSAFRQTDLKAMVAYSSINHMGFVLLGIASLNTAGFIGAGMQMLTHGIITGALFLLVGGLYERTHTREINDYGGLSRVTPVFAALTSLTLLASMGMPGLAGFVSELHALLGGVGRFHGTAAVAVIGVLVTAAYSLRAIGKLFFGPVNPRWAGLGDAGARELVAVAPLGALMVGLGIAPGVALDLLTITARQMTAMFP